MNQDISLHIHSNVLEFDRELICCFVCLTLESVVSFDVCVCSYLCVGTMVLHVRDCCVFGKCRYNTDTIRV